jgi:hypothetical protein
MTPDNHRAARRPILALAFLALAGIGASITAGSVSAQSTTGTLEGQVTTQLGVLPGMYAGPLPGVRIRLTGAGQQYEGYSQDAGYYKFEQLPPGEYDLIATFNGARPYEKQVEIIAGETTTLNIIMAP